MAGISFVVVGKTLYQTKAYLLRFSRRCKNQTIKSSQKKLQNTTIDLPGYIFRVSILRYSWRLFFFTLLLNFYQLCE